MNKTVPVGGSRRIWQRAVGRRIQARRLRSGGGAVGENVRRCGAFVPWCLPILPPVRLSGWPRSPPARRPVLMLQRSEVEGRMRLVCELVLRRAGELEEADEASEPATVPRWLGNRQVTGERQVAARSK